MAETRSSPAPAIRLIRTPPSLEPLVDDRDVPGQHRSDVAQLLDLAVEEQEAARAHGLHDEEVVRHEEQRPPLGDELGHPLDALRLEPGVAHGQRLVHDEDVRVQERGDREPKPELHPGRVELDGRVDRVLELGELDDLVEAARGPRTSSSRGSVRRARCSRAR